MSLPLSLFKRIARVRKCVPCFSSWAKMSMATTPSDMDYPIGERFLTAPLVWIQHVSVHPCIHFLRVSVFNTPAQISQPRLDMRSIVVFTACQSLTPRHLILSLSEHFQPRLCYNKNNNNNIIVPIIIIFIIMFNQGKVILCSEWFNVHSCFLNPLNSN